MAELRVKSTGTIKLFESDNTSNVTIASPASLGGDRTITLPDASVTLASGTMLATDGSGASLTALNASELGSGTVPTARLGTGTASSSTILYGDQTYKTAPSGGNYSVHAVSQYTEDTAYNLANVGNSEQYVITDEYITLTPTHTSDIFLCLVNMGTSASSINIGFGLHMIVSTTTDFSSGNTTVGKTGRYSQTLQSLGGEGQMHENFSATVTGLTADTAHYFQCFGMTHYGATGTVGFNKTAGAGDAAGVGSCQVIQFKYEG